MGKNKRLKHEYIYKAQELIRRFGGANLGSLPSEDHLEIVRIYYPGRIRGTPIEELKAAQLYRIAQRLYDQAHEIVDRLKKGESLEGKVST